jgi:hypothetical protein
MNYTCKVYNNTTLPVVVESWINKSELTTMIGITVKPDETVEVPSITGEWYLHNLLQDSSQFKMWEDAGYNSIGRLGKFRDKPAYDRQISWMDYDEFDVKLINGIYVFSKN